MARGNWTKKWTLVMGDPEQDGSLHKDEWGSTLHEEKKLHLHPHALIPEHRQILISTILHEIMHITQPSWTEEEVGERADRMADFFMANPHIHAVFSRYKPIRSKRKCPCGKK